MPALIEWRSQQRPTQQLEDRGCSIVRFEGFHPDFGRLARSVEALGLQPDLVLKPLAPGQRPYLVAWIKTPRGLRTLGGPLK